MVVRLLMCIASLFFVLFFFFFNDTATTEIYTLSLHDALPIYFVTGVGRAPARDQGRRESAALRRNRGESAGAPAGARASGADDHSSVPGRDDSPPARAGAEGPHDAPGG